MSLKSCGSIVLVIAGLLLPPAAPGADLIVREDFEEGPSWRYASRWNMEQYLSDRWTIVSTEKHGGSYAAESKQPGDPSWVADSVFCKTLPTDADAIFIRFWYKAGPKQNNCGFQFMRLTAVSGSDEIEIGNGHPCGRTSKCHCYSPEQSVQVRNGWKDPTRATEWTEFAVYIDYAQNRMIYWRNPKKYTKRDRSAVEVSFKFGKKYNRVILGAYYKNWKPAAGRDGWTFWMDDIEVWSGIPESLEGPEDSEQKG
ncbi:MAG: hypothetical protein AB1640_14140 [bacterium]